MPGLTAHPIRHPPLVASHLTFSFPSLSLSLFLSASRLHLLSLVSITSSSSKGAIHLCCYLRLDTFSFQGLLWCSVLSLIIPHCSRDPSGRHFLLFSPSRRPRLWNRLLTPFDIFLLYIFWTFSRFVLTYSQPIYPDRSLTARETATAVASFGLKARSFSSDSPVSNRFSLRRLPSGLVLPRPVVHFPRRRVAREQIQ